MQATHIVRLCSQLSCKRANVSPNRHGSSYFYFRDQSTWGNSSYVQFVHASVKCKQSGTRSSKSWLLELLEAS